MPRQEARGEGRGQVQPSGLAQKASDYQEIKSLLSPEALGLSLGVDIGWGLVGN